MLVNKKKILFLSHDATRTGAPILLLNLLRLLKEYTEEFSISVVIKNGFDSHDILLKEFEKTCTTVVWRKKQLNGGAGKIKNYIKSKFKQRNDGVIARLIADSDFIFTNTLTNGDFFAYYNKSINKPVYCYVHELEIATCSYTNENNLSVLLSKTNYYFSPSDAVSAHMVNALGINRQKIYQLNYFIPLLPQPERSKQELGELLNIGIVGTLDWRKGADILATIVSTLFKKYPESNIQFIWKGVNLDSIEYKRCLYELKQAGCMGKVKFEPSSAYMTDFYQSIDLLLLPSKEDPYPLVVLEAASFKKPTICFEKSGGAPEFVEDDAGSVVPYLDLNTLNEEIISYYLDRTKCVDRGNCAYLKYKSRHMNEQLVISQLVDGLSIKYKKQ